MPTLRTPRFRVVYQPVGTTSEDDRREVEVQSTQADVIRYDLVRTRKGWPQVKDAPMLWTSFVAWAAMLRQDMPVPSTFDEGMHSLLSVEGITKQGEQVTEATDPDDLAVDPTHGTA